MEFVNSLKKHELWLYFAWQDIVMRYRRTVVGPFWLVITTFISVILTAFLGSLLFKTKLEDYFLYVACGMISWSLLSVLMTEACTVFVNAGGLIKNIKMPLLTFCFRLFVRNLMVYMHNFVMVLLGILFFTGRIPLTIVLLLPVFILLFLNSVSLSISLGFLATRLRDVTQAVVSLMSILGFVTPIMWRPEMLSDKAYIAEFNPFTHFIALLREPLLGSCPPLSSILIVCSITILNAIVAYCVYKKFNSRLVFWL